MMSGLTRQAGAGGCDRGQTESRRDRIRNFCERAMALFVERRGQIGYCLPIGFREAKKVGFKMNFDRPEQYEVEVDTPDNSVGNELLIGVARNVAAVDLLRECREKVKATAETQSRSIDLLYDALASTLDLFTLWMSDATARGEIEQLLEQHGICCDGRTRNPLTPIVKLAFGKAFDRSNINRNAAALKYAHDRGVKPDDLAGFFTAAGGVAKCAAAEAKMRQTGTEDAASRAAAALAAKREHAVPIPLPDAVAAPAQGLFSLLVERGDNGRFVILASSAEDEHSVRRFLTQVRVNT